MNEEQVADHRDATRKASSDLDKALDRNSEKRSEIRTIGFHRLFFWSGAHQKGSPGRKCN